eukprot:8982840-Karenia_brevis.AAC.1
MKLSYLAQVLPIPKIVFQLQRTFVHKLFKAIPSTFKESDFVDLRCTGVDVFLIGPWEFAAKTRCYLKHAQVVQALALQLYE